MALVKVKPTSPGRRAVVKVVNENLHKGKPFAGLVESQSKNAGRNNNGRITVRHQGGGHKQHYRVVDFKRNKDGIPAKVERLEYDPNRTANIALLCYADGERRYIIAPRGLTVGQEVMSGSEAPIKAGNALPIRNIPVGTTIHCIEMVPGKGAQMARSAGAGVQLMAREGVYAQVRLRSGEVRRVHVECRATIGEVGNEEHSLRKIGKADMPLNDALPLSARHTHARVMKTWRDYHAAHDYNYFTLDLGFLTAIARATVNTDISADSDNYAADIHSPLIALENALHLVRRVLVVWLTVLALLVLAGWVV